MLMRDEAAAYLSVSPGMFDAMVKDRRMPPPKLLGAHRKAWDRRELDIAIDQLPTEVEDDSDRTWAE